ncbi:glycosyltransferase family 39 protein [Chloracidobacterium aggregatum]|uniref:ArnT family glycosyltransferase n=1 Tax=Chloracidobacterium aggregatum TaxID=2851959 RepID=UPI001FEE498B|nr:glycosyltransferase family 39 protein [Chloracidobacterium aggregatum]
MPDDTPRPSRSDAAYLAAYLALACGIAFFWQLGNLGLVGPDEPRYAQVAREMWQRGDWLTPTLGGTTWFEKPALLYWLMGFSFQLVGFNEWGARLPSAVAATLTVLLLGTLRPPLGPAAALLAATSPLMLAFARAATFEALLTLAVTTATLAFHLSFEAARQARPTRVRLTLYLFYVALGVGMLAKGLVGLVLPLGSLLFYLLLTPDLRRRPWETLRHLRPLTGSLLVLAVAGLWYIPVIVRHGWPFIEEFFIAHHFQRFTSNRFRHPGPVYYYLPVLLAGLLPWSLWLIAGLYRAVRPVQPSAEGHETSENTSTDDDKPLVRLALCGFITPLLFFSFSGSKLPGYILPAVPFAALLAAHGLYRLSGRQHLLGLCLASLSQLGLYIGLQLATCKLSEEKLLSAPEFFSGGLLVTALGLSALHARQRMSGLFRLVLVQLGLVLWVTAQFPVLEPRFSTKSLTALMARQAQPAELVVFFRCREYAPVFYNPDHTTCCDAAREPNQISDPADLAAIVARRGTLLVIFPQRERPALEAETWTVRLLGTSGRFALARLTATALPDRPDSPETGEVRHHGLVPQHDVVQDAVGADMHPPPQNGRPDNRPLGNP